MLETTFTTMFASFVIFVGGVISITEMVNKLFKVNNQTAKLFISWSISLVLSVIGFVFQLGFFADCGSIDSWQGWVKVASIGIGCALAANKIYDREEIWRALELIFSLFKKDGKEIRVKLKNKK